MQISRHFKLVEFERNGNIIKEPEIKENIKALCENVLDSVRDKFGTTIIRSGYRTKDYNIKIGGARNSQHIKGEAADIVCIKAKAEEVWEWISENCEYDQLILEKGRFGSMWVHVSYTKDKNRREKFRINN